MSQWFGPSSKYSFEIFGFSHLVMLTLFCLSFIYLLFYSSHFKRGTRAHELIRWTLLILLVISELSYQIWAVTHDLFSSIEHLPLHLCGIASIFGVISLLTYNKKLIQYNFFIGIIPAVVALITPEIPHGYEHFRYWKFFIHHMAIPWTSLFLILTTKVSINWRVMSETYCYLVIYALIIGGFNSIFGTNYLYLAHPPAAVTILSYLEVGVGYHLNLGFLAFSIFIILLMLYKWIECVRRSEKDGI
ncbi:TIGR02206 family membrane protein [Halobacillus seohaensis]|uniref:TIGR02206 family membrane protein n=1 Tax=Halobacillus seohaensis TaxID=447421 RepID=A0ABW2EJ06_9BACI